MWGNAETIYHNFHSSLEMLDKAVNSNHSSLFSFCENTICHPYYMSDRHCFRTVLALILKPWCIWVAIQKASASVGPTGLFLKSCLLWKVVTTALALASASAEDFLLPVDNHKAWVQLQKCFFWCFLPGIYQRSSVKPGSPLLFSALFYVPGTLGEGLESILGAET